MKCNHKWKLRYLNKSFYCLLCKNKYAYTRNGALRLQGKPE